MSRSRQTRSRIAVATPWLAVSLLAAMLVPSGSARAPSVAKGDGTLRVAIYMDPGGIEPATVRAAEHSAALMHQTQLSLVTYREDGGPGTGRQIIPYGAQMPNLSDDGKTYTFRIRPGLQFSDGKPVTALSFQAGFERLLDPRMSGLAGVQPGGFENVVGAPAFMRGRAASVSGVRATKDRLIFHLAKAEPDFLSRLTGPRVSAMPLDLPAGVVDAPLPSAGPYYIQEYVPNRSVQMVRNPYWKPSTLPTRPANFQKIDYLERATAEAAVAAVSNDDADVAAVLDTRDLPPAVIRDLKSRYGVNRRRFWVRPRSRRYSLVFNTRRPLFHDARPRLAVSFALDRTKLRDNLGPLAGQVTDQLLLPTSAAFLDWKLYPFHPYLKRARRLARGALPGKDAILIVGSTVGWGPAVGNVIRSNLDRIGLHVKVVPKAPSVFHEYLRNPNNPWDLATMVISPARVDPMVFINYGLEGHSYDVIPPGGCPCIYNYSGFDDPKWVRRMQRTDSRRHGRLKEYALLDRDLMQRAAPIAPYATGNSLTLVSRRIGCFRSSAYPANNSPNLAALCVR